MEEPSSMKVDETVALRRRMTRGTASIAFQRLVEVTVSFLLVPYMLHKLGGAAYGYWALIYAVANYLNLTDFGVSAALNFHFVSALTAGDEKQKREYFSSAFLYLFVVATGVFLLGLIVEHWVLDFFTGSRDLGIAANWAWRSMMTVLALGFITSYGRALFMSTHRVSTLGMLSTTLAVLYGIAVSIALALGGGLIGLAMASAGVAVLRLALIFGLGASGTPGFKLSVSSVQREAILKFWRFGLRVIVARMAEVIYSSFDRLILGRMMGLSIVAWYDIGAKAAGVAQQGPLVMLPVVEPEAARFHAGGETAKLHLLLERAGKYAALIGFPMVVFLIVAGNAVLRIWIGSRVNSQMVEALAVLVVAYVGMALTSPLRSVGRGIGHPGWEARAAMLQAIANVLLSIILYFQFGFRGVLLGTLFAMLLGQGWFITMVLPGLKLKIGTFLKASWLRPMMASVLAGLAAWSLLRWGIPLPSEGGRISALLPGLSSAVLFAIVYAGSALFLKATSVREVKMLFNALRGKSTT
ncbi:MAG: lipopolysaccharide biosynthesis protein [bacterium]